MNGIPQGIGKSNLKLSDVQFEKHRIWARVNIRLLDENEGTIEWKTHFHVLKIS